MVAATQAPEQIKNDSGTRDGKYHHIKGKQNWQRNTKPAECANEHSPHTYPKTSKVTSSCEIKGTARTTCMRQELSELHPSREAPKRTRHEENKIPNQEANHGSRPEMRAASQPWKTTKQKPSKKQIRKSRGLTNTLESYAKSDKFLRCAILIDIITASS